MPSFATPIRSLVLFGAVLPLFAGAVLAQDAPPPERPAMSRADFLARAEQRFAAMDADHDGKVTRAEYDAAIAARAGGGGRPGMGSRGFDRMDSDGDGVITVAEARDTAGRLFDMMDSNHDGLLSADEREAMRGMGRGMGGGMGRGGDVPAPAPAPAPQN